MRLHQGEGVVSLVAVLGSAETLSFSAKNEQFKETGIPTKRKKIDSTPIAFMLGRISCSFAAVVLLLDVLCVPYLVPSNKLPCLGFPYHTVPFHVSCPGSVCPPT
jgi:hypothetical protein